MAFDCIIRNAAIVDGSGDRAPYAGDVGVAGDKIAAVGSLDGAQARTTIDAGGRALSPGFIDAHVHSEIPLLGGRDQLAALYQGVTTHFLAPDGFGWAPLSHDRAREMWRNTQFAYPDDKGLALDWSSPEEYLSIFPGKVPANVYPQVPHCAVRLGAMGWDPRPASDAELAVMAATTRQWLEAGAGVLCLGLDYQPSANADLRELVELSKIAASYGALYAAHLRYQILGRPRAWEEIIEISRQARIPVHVSHERVDGESEEILARIDREDVDLSFESYLYPAGMTHMLMQLPMPVQAGTPDEVLQRLKDPETRRASLPYLKQNLGPLGNQIVGYTPSGRYIGMTISAAAESLGKSWEDFIYDLIVEEDGVETFVCRWHTPEDKNQATIERTAVHPRMMIASDGIYDIPHPHPRGYGCFARVLRQFVRQRGLLSLQEAVYKMSGYPARRFGLADRGRIAEGMAADLVLFDPDTVADRSTWDEPVQRAVGVDQVMVNGTWVIERGEWTGHLPGRVLRRS